MAFVCPWVKSPVWVLVMARTGAAGSICVVSKAAPVPIDPPPESWAWLVTEEGAFDATFTVTVIAG